MFRSQSFDHHQGSITVLVQLLLSACALCHIPVCGCMLSVRLCVWCTFPCGVWLCTGGREVTVHFLYTGWPRSHRTLLIYRVAQKSPYTSYIQGGREVTVHRPIRYHKLIWITWIHVAIRQFIHEGSAIRPHIRVFLHVVLHCWPLSLRCVLSGCMVTSRPPCT
jgi:hypothetical protein